MEDKEKQGKKNVDVIVTIAAVGHIPLEHLPNFKHTIEAIPKFNLIILKTSSGKLWIKEGNDGY